MHFLALYTNEPTDADVFSALPEKEKAVTRNKDNRRVSFIFFSIHGYTDRPEALAAARNDVVLCE